MYEHEHGHGHEREHGHGHVAADGMVFISTSLAATLEAVTGGGSLAPRAIASSQGYSENICRGVLPCLFSKAVSHPTESSRSIVSSSPFSAA